MLVFYYDCCLFLFYYDVMAHAYAQQAEATSSPGWVTQKKSFELTRLSEKCVAVCVAVMLHLCWMMFGCGDRTSGWRPATEAASTPSAVIWAQMHVRYLLAGGVAVEMSIRGQEGMPMEI